MGKAGRTFWGEATGGVRALRARRAGQRGWAGAAAEVRASVAKPAGACPSSGACAGGPRGTGRETHLRGVADRHWGDPGPTPWCPRLLMGPSPQVWVGPVTNQENAGRVTGARDDSTKDCEPLRSQAVPRGERGPRAASDKKTKPLSYSRGNRQSPSQAATLRRATCARSRGPASVPAPRPRTP